MKQLLGGIMTLCLTFITLGSSLAAEPFMEKDPVEMVVIPAGPFIRGSGEGEGRPDERPRRKIFLNSFAIDKYEVTNRRYQQFVDETLHKPPFNVYGDGRLSEIPEVAHRPVVQVTWHDAVDYCFWAGKRLPTEAEWEKAAGGKEGLRFPWGDNPGDKLLANYDKEWNGSETLSDVTSMPEGASPYGLFHMAGNVREWVHDWYNTEYYEDSPSKNPKGPDTGILKVIRGGSWHSFLSDLRVASRGKGGFALKTHGIGFRCARDIGATRKTKDETIH